MFRTIYDTYEFQYFKDIIVQYYSANKYSYEFDHVTAPRNETDNENYNAFTEKQKVMKFFYKKFSLNTCCCVECCMERDHFEDEDCLGPSLINNYIIYKLYGKEKKSRKWLKNYFDFCIFINGTTYSGEEREICNPEKNMKLFGLKYTKTYQEYPFVKKQKDISYLDDYYSEKYSSEDYKYSNPYPYSLTRAKKSIYSDSIIDTENDKSIKYYFVEYSVYKNKNSFDYYQINTRNKAIAVIKYNLLNNL